ncbi:hypothetical protein [Winogradskyella sp.]|uniref:hypothetical protein n=1 Tax=Winogradskyella sp. TaxID=1883156 RepID=UPI002626D7FD|nr:hypothetical protein [Winogradskyella sp.]
MKKKRYKYIKSVFILSFMALLLAGCEEDLETDLSNFVGFEIDSEPFRRLLLVEPNGTTTFEERVYASERSSSERRYQVTSSLDMHNAFIEDNGALPRVYISSNYTLSEVVIPANSLEGTFTVTIEDDDVIGPLRQQLTLGFVDEAGVDFAGPISLSINEACGDGTTLVNFSLGLDDWPDETNWELYDLTSGQVLVDSDGPFGNPEFDNFNLFYDFCLPPGNYGMVVYDSFGDGGVTYSVKLGDQDDFLVDPIITDNAQSVSTFTIE